MNVKMMARVTSCILLVEPHEVREDLAAAGIVGPKSVVTLKHIFERLGEGVSLGLVELVEATDVCPGGETHTEGVFRSEGHEPNPVFGLEHNSITLRQFDVDFGAHPTWFARRSQLLGGSGWDEGERVDLPMWMVNRRADFLSPTFKHQGVSNLWSCQQRRGPLSPQIDDLSDLRNAKRAK